MSPTDDNDDDETTTDKSIRWPIKTREYHDHHMDSTMWNDFQFRDNDIIIGTYPKSGTTWMQQIIAQLMFDGDTSVDVRAMSPWVDLRMPPRDVKLPAIVAQTHRRFLKTHLPVDALVFSPKAKYVYIARDGRDVCWSWHNHHKHASESWYAMLNDTPGRVGPKIDKPNEDIVAYFREWLERDGFPILSFWDNIESWWKIKDLPNVKLIHFNDLKQDMEGEIRKIAAFLDLKINEEKWEEIVEHCSFDWMKKNPGNVAPLGGIFWDGGGSFINKGTNRRWTELLSKEDCEHYEQLAEEKLGKECADWLKNGSLK